jgi:hypothetical protein
VRLETVDAERGTHGTLDVELADVLPVLLQQRHQEVHRQVNVVDEFGLGHRNVANRNTQDQILLALELELDRRLLLVHLLGDVVIVAQYRRKLARLVQAGTKNTRQPFDQFSRRKESVVLLSELLDKFVVALELREVVNALEGDASGLGLITMLLISEDADSKLLARRRWKLDGAAEALVTNRIVVFQHDLKLDGFQKFALLLSGGEVQHAIDGFVQRFRCDFAGHGKTQNQM